MGRKSRARRREAWAAYYRIPYDWGIYCNRAKLVELLVRQNGPIDERAILWALHKVRGRDAGATPAAGRLKTYPVAQSIEPGHPLYHAMLPIPTLLPVSSARTFLL